MEPKITVIGLRSEIGSSKQLFRSAMIRALWSAKTNTAPFASRTLKARLHGDRIELEPRGPAPRSVQQPRERSPLLALVSVRQCTGSPIDVRSGTPCSPGLGHPQAGTAPRCRTGPPSRSGNTPGILADIGSIWYGCWSQNPGFRIAYREYSLCSSRSSWHRWCSDRWPRLTVKGWGKRRRDRIGFRDRTAFPSSARRRS